MQTLKRLNKLTIYILLYISVAVCLSDTVVEGHIYDSNEFPISNVEVYIKELSAGSTTDSSGYFKMILPASLLKKNRYILEVSHIAYVSKKINLSKKNNLKIYLDKNIIGANQIVVTALGYKSHIKNTPVITHIITANDIYNSPYNSASDIIEFVMPNVQRVHDPHGPDDKIKIQGLDNRFVVFMIDGNRISGEFAGNIDLSIINIDDIERIEIIRSGMSTLYGSDSMGGLINIITKKNRRPIAVNTSYNHDLPANQSLSFGFGAQIYSFNYKLNLNYNNSPGYDLTDRSPLNKTVEENLNFKINNSFSYSWRKFLIKYMNQYYEKEINLYTYRADYDDENGTPITISNLLSIKHNPRYKDYMNALNINYELSDISNFKFRFSKESYNKGIYYPYYYNSYPNSKGATKISATPARYDCSIFFNTSIKAHSFSAGMEYAKETYQAYDVFSLNGELLTYNIFTDSKERTINEYSIFLTDKFKILNSEIVLGLRSTQYSSYKRRFIPSLSIRQEFYGQNLRANYSKGYRIPSIKELYYDFPDHPAGPLYGNPDLKPSISDYYAISIESMKSTNSSFEIYLNNVEDMIYMAPTNGDTMEYVNTERASLFGANINIDIPVNKRLAIKSVLSYTDGKSNDQKLIDAISKYSFNIRFKYNVTKNLSLLFMTKYNSSKTVYIYQYNHFYKFDLYSISDILLSMKYKNISIKGGVKNILNYLDPSRKDYRARENLSTIDPGRRIYFSISFSI